MPDTRECECGRRIMVFRFKCVLCGVKQDKAEKAERVRRTLNRDTARSA